MSEFNQTDQMVTRDRTSRMINGVLLPIAALIMGYAVGSEAASFFRLPGIIGTSLGLGLAGLALHFLIPRLYVTNDAVAAFVTVDMLTKELVTYGPGLHWSFPWEGRSGANNVNLEEVAENYEVEVVLKDGSIVVPFSARLRPDICRLPNFLSGVGALAADLKDIIGSQIVTFFTSKDVGVKEALKLLGDLNDDLHEKFKFGVSPDFEDRFGIMTGDITAGTFKVSKQIEETMGALTESRLIDQALAESFGLENNKEVAEAIATGALDREDVNRRRTQIMAMSGNLQGMDLKETTTNFRIQGLDKVDPKFAEALANLAPALNALFAAQRQQPGTGKRQTS